MTTEVEFKEKWEEQLEIIDQVRSSISQIMIGQKNVIEQVWIAILAGGHALLEGVPGLGKTLLVRTISQSLDLSFSRIQFTPDLMPADIVGTQMITTDENGRNTFRFQPGPIFGNLVLADEINRATPKTQSALLEAMQEHTVTVAGETRPLPKPFFVLATQNPLEMEGTYVLPEAQLDRFLFKIVVDFPTEEELKLIVTSTSTNKKIELKPITDGTILLEMQKMIRDLLVSDEVVEEAVKLLMMTHPTHSTAPESVRQYVRAGAGPRGVQALIQTAKARAFLHRRFNVSREDIEAVAPSVFRHRILRNFEAEAVGMTTDQLLSEILSEWKKGSLQ
ncbi:AAA family ATPase [Hazenella coriacea]|uniref:MoxR-like ATPase n=1 Tax=Hazenella coriacea TaxID=1179467 RepID=A0A4R3LB76_9BACL|nr:MoxR family ATPase [Hazenella coriacea]TCS96972.1 MoxR-like ATPase [Hazenella coriacea]